MIHNPVGFLSAMFLVVFLTRLPELVVEVVRAHIHDLVVLDTGEAFRVDVALVLVLDQTLDHITFVDLRLVVSDQEFLDGERGHCISHADKPHPTVTMLSKRARTEQYFSIVG